MHTASLSMQAPDGLSHVPSFRIITNTGMKPFLRLSLNVQLYKGGCARAGSGSITLGNYGNSFGGFF